jgi:hypothetical protein
MIMEYGAINYKTTHWERRVEFFVQLTLWTRIRLLFGLPVDLKIERRYAAEHETPLNSTVCDVALSIHFNKTW